MFSHNESIVNIVNEMGVGVKRAIAKRDRHSSMEPDHPKKMIGTPESLPNESKRQTSTYSAVYTLPAKLVEPNPQFIIAHKNTSPETNSDAKNSPMFVQTGKISSTYSDKP